MPSLNIQRDGPRLLSNIQVYREAIVLDGLREQINNTSSSCSREDKSHMVKIFYVSRVADEKKLHH
jgi:hypothetical protein